MGTLALPFLFSDLRNRRPAFAVTATVHGHTVPGVGGGDFRFDPASTKPDDGGNVANPSGAQPGRWIRIVSGPSGADSFGAIGDGDGIGGGTDDHAALTAALAASDHVRLSGTHRIASDLTIPAGKVLHFDQGGMLAPDAGKTLSGRIALAGPPPTQLFGGLGTLNFAIDCAGPVRAEWFGTKSDYNGGFGPTSGTDNTIPLQNAIDCAALSGRSLSIAPGLYRTVAPLVVNGTLGTPQYGLIIEGMGAGASGATTNAVISCDFDYSAEPHGTSFAIGTYDTSDPLLQKLQITGLSGMSATSVGGFLYLTGCGHTINNGAHQIVQYDNPTSVWVLALEATAADTGTNWRNPQKTGLRILSRDCRVKGLLVTPAPGTILAAAIEDTQGAQGICSDNEFHDVGVYATGSGLVINAFSHADSTVQPGHGPFYGDCENTRYIGCYSS